MHFKKKNHYYLPNFYIPNFFSFLIFQYLIELKESGARIIIGDFFKNAAQKVMCEAYKLHMTQKEGYVWFLPGWYHPDWYKLDDLRELEVKKNNSEKNDQKESIPDCSTDEMIQVKSKILL